MPHANNDDENTYDQHQTTPSPECDATSQIDGGDNNNDDDRIVADSSKSDSSQYGDQSPFITGISEHTVNTTTCTVELNTVSSDGEWSWIPEIDVQKSVPDVLYRY
ncbi:hypothetical protein ACHAPO_006763 [Fusarium lateritium]